MNSGAADVFEHGSLGWEQTEYVAAANADAEDNFGHAVALSENTMMVGAPLEDGNGLGDPENNGRSKAGAGYIFDLGAGWGSYCDPVAQNSAGHLGEISHSGSLVLGDNALVLHAQGLPQNQVAFFLSSRGRTFLASPGGSQGNLCVGGGHGLIRHNRQHEVRFSGNSGQVQLALDLNDMPDGQVVAAGESWNFQCWYRDLNPGPTSNLTGGLSVGFE